MQFGTGWNVAAELRWCGARGDNLESALGQEAVLDQLLGVLDIPAREAALRGLSYEQKTKVADAHLAYLATAPSSAWEGVAVAEIAAAHLHRAALSPDVRAQVFRPAALEDELRAPVRSWLEGSRKLKVTDEVDLCRKRADLVGRRPENLLFEERVIAVELKNSVKEFDRAMNQLSTYADYAHETYLACTPDFVAQYRWHCFSAPSVHRYDPGVLGSALARVGAGLLLVEGQSVSVALKPQKRGVTESKLQEVRAEIAAVAARTAAAKSTGQLSQSP